MTDRIQKLNDQIATRHLRVVKYRGAMHGTNEFPFLIGDDGISVLPITSLALNHKVSDERIATMTDGQRAVSTGTLNTPGRMGSPDSEIFICNAAVVAASALNGCITDPRPYLAEAIARGDVL